jgi:pimeloyl-ACP methyl ester carboxylesterase
MLRCLPVPRALILLATLATGSALAAPCAAPDHLTRVTGGRECLIVKTYGQATDGRPTTLFVLLHGNHSDGSPATSQFRVAEALAARAEPDSIAVALIRPGYDDEQGQLSSGDAAGRADNFHAENIDTVAAAIARLKDFHGAARLVLLGHSGGAAMAGVILGRHPGLADAAVLVGCPCDVQAWRFMRGRPGAWRSESAVRYVDRVPTNARVAVLVGSRDDVTPPFLSRDYVAALSARGIAADLSVIDGGSHVDVIRSPQVLDAALRLGRND